jgi:hypothetical protein
VQLYAVTMIEDDPGPMLGPDPIFYGLVFWAEDERHAIEQAEDAREEPAHRVIYVLPIPPDYTRQP